MPVPVGHLRVEKVLAPRGDEGGEAVVLGLPLQEGACGAVVHQLAQPPCPRGRLRGREADRGGRHASGGENATADAGRHHVLHA